MVTATGMVQPLCGTPMGLQDKVTGDLVTNHKKIAQRYLTGWFAVDLLATFPVDYIVRAVEVSTACADDVQWSVP